jgi:hypothetical protein
MLEETGILGSEILEDGLGTPLGAKYKKLFRQNSRAVFAQILRRVPEPSKADREKVLASIERMRRMPQQMRPFLRKRMKELPRAQSGPKNKLTLEQEIVACAQVTLLRDEYSDREAIQQVARKYRISERTMYRKWRKHRQIKKANQRPS